MTDDELQAIREWVTEQEGKLPHLRTGLAPDRVASLLAALDAVRAERGAREVVYVLTESGIDHHGIVAIYATREEAEHEAVYCRAREAEHEPEDWHRMTYDVEEWPLGESVAGLLVRMNTAAEVTDMDWFSGVSIRDQLQLGRVRHYDTPWPNGTVGDVFARSVDEAKAIFASRPHPTPRTRPTAAGPKDRN